MENGTNSLIVLGLYVNVCFEWGVQSICQIIIESRESLCRRWWK